MEKIKPIFKNGIELIEWIIFGVITGAIAGLIGTAFHYAVDYVTEVRLEHTWILFLSPLAGIFIIYLYKFLKTEKMGTDTVIDAAQNKKDVSILLAPTIFIATILTHFVGGSVGREGAALQIGGSVGSFVGKLTGLSKKDQSAVILAGMAAVFSALFGTPVGATIFVCTVLVVKKNFEECFLPTIVAAITANYVAQLCGVPPTRFIVPVIEITPMVLLATILLGIAFSLVANLFFRFNFFLEELFEERIPNAIIRTVAGTAVLIALTLLVQSMRYNGAGMGVITAAIEQGEANYYDFLFKILFTAVSLAAGLKGGEVVPSFFIGATFGAVIAPLVGIPAGLVAALGMITVFCGCTNTLLASLVLGIEMFGIDTLPLFALCLTVCHITSTEAGFYKSQKSLL